MRIKILLVFALAVFAEITSAQVPQKLSFQAVLRNTRNELVANTKVGMRITILKNNQNDSIAYSEVQNPTTNAYGLINIEIGEGKATAGAFAAIDWSTGNYYVKTETDING